MLGKGVLLIWIKVGQRPTALVEGAGGDCLDIFLIFHFPILSWGWSGGAKVLGKLPEPGRPTVWMIVGQGPTVLAVGAGGGCLDFFTLHYLFSSFSLSLRGGPI